MDNSNSRRISPERRMEATIRMVQRSQTGESVSEISRNTGISRQRLYELEDSYNQRRSVEDRSRTGRPSKVTPQIESRVIRSLASDPSESSKQMKNTINIGLNPKEMISDRTIRRIAVNRGLRSRRPAFKPFLTQQHKAQRLEFAKSHLNRDMRFWAM